MRGVVALYLAVAATLASGCAKTDWIDRALVTVDVTGMWYGTMAAAGGLAYGTSQEMWLDLERKGAKVNGSIRYRPDQGFARSGPVEGTVAGDVLRYKLVRDSHYIELTVSGDEMKGLDGSNPFSFQRISSSPR